MLKPSPMVARGWLHALDPRSKLALCAVAIAFVLNAHAFALLLTACAAIGVLRSSRISWRQTRAIGAALTPLVGMVLLTWPLFYSRGTEVWFAWSIIRITQDGVLGGLTTALRILALVYVIALLGTTTNQSDLIRALVKLRLPYVWGLTIAMSLRYIPTLYTLYQTVSDAQRARGWDSPQGNWLKRAYGYLPVLIAVLIGALRLSDQTAMALHARGFDTSRTRIAYRDVSFGARDWLVLMLTGIGLILWVLTQR